MLAIHHIGSTSVPGLSAKKDLDILLVINNLEDSLLLQSIGYIYKGEINIPLRYFFSKNNKITKVNLHVCEKSHSFINLNLLFRDYLRNNERYRNDYQKLKYSLVQDPDISIKQQEYQFTKYNLGKNNFINNILTLAKFNETRFVFCAHYNEWSAAKKHRNEYFSNLYKIKDPYTYTFNDENHKHCILYKGTEIIGYTHIQLLDKNKAIIHMTTMEKLKSKENYKSKFIQFIEKWLRLQNYKVIHVKVAPLESQYYEKQGYKSIIQSDSDDFDSHSCNVVMGKIL